MLSDSLKSLRILDFTRLYPGPLCTMMLADLGADVIKIESLDGESGRSLPPFAFDRSIPFMQLNRNKRSLAMNLRTGEAQGIIRKLLGKSDVLIESFRPGVMKKFGLDYESIHDHFPQLVYCSISGYGQQGPEADRPGHDINYISVAGMLGCGPSFHLIPPVQIADTMGAYQAITAILAALIQRNRERAGQFLDISLLDGVFTTMILIAGTAIAGQDTSTDQYLSGKLACYNIYETSDNRYLALGLLEPKFWDLFCRKMNLSELSSLQFQDNQKDLKRTVGDRLKSRSLQDWLEYFQDEDLCITPVQTIQEAMNSEYARHRKIFQTVEYSFGSMLQMTTPFVKSPSMNRAPEAGEHSSEILRESGYTPEEIEAFRGKGIIR